MTGEATTPTPEHRTLADMTPEEWREERRRRKRERREAQLRSEREFRELCEKKGSSESSRTVEQPAEGGGTIVFGRVVRGRLNFPKGRFPAPGKIEKKGAVVSASFHLVLILIIILGPVVARRAMGNPGEPGGGGGGGGGRQIHLIELPPAAASAPAARVAEAVRAPVPPPEPVENDIYTLPMPDVVETAADVDVKVAETKPVITLESLGLGLGRGTGDGAGEGTGTGGGVGSGEGEGIGAGVGDGTGGDGGDVLAPEPRTVIYPFEEAPDDVRGVELTVHFWVDRRGRVTKVEIAPQVRDSDFRRKLMDRMKAWVFYPARTLSGAPVEGEYFMTVTF